MTYTFLSFEPYAGSESEWGGATIDGLMTIRATNVSFPWLRCLGAKVTTEELQFWGSSTWWEKVPRKGERMGVAMSELLNTFWELHRRTPTTTTGRTNVR